MIRRPPGSTRIDTLFPYTTRFRSVVVHFAQFGNLRIERGDLFFEVQKGCHAESLGRRLRKVNAIHASERMPLVDQLDEAAAVDMRVNFGRRDVGVAEQDRKSTRLNSSH